MLERTRKSLAVLESRKYQKALESIKIPDTLDNDRDDLPFWGKKFAMEVHDVSGARNFATHGEDHDMVTKHKQWRRAVQSYLATVALPKSAGVSLIRFTV